MIICGLLILILAIPVSAVAANPSPSTAKCYAFWASECFQIRDARTRDITHHVLITRGPQSTPKANDGCEGTLENALDADQRADLLDEFNDVLDGEDGCRAIERAPLYVFPDHRSAIDKYRRLTRPGSHKEIHELDAPELP